MEYQSVVHHEPWYHAYHPGNTGTVAIHNDYSIPVRKRHNVGVKFQDTSRMLNNDSKLWAKMTVQNPTPFGYLWQMAENGVLDRADYSQIPKSGAVPQIYSGNPENLWLADNNEPGVIPSLQGLITGLQGQAQAARPAPSAINARSRATLSHPVYKSLNAGRHPRRDILHAAYGQPVPRPEKNAPAAAGAPSTPAAPYASPGEKACGRLSPHCHANFVSIDPSNPLQQPRRAEATTQYIVGQDARYRAPTGGSASGAVNTGFSSAIVTNVSSPWGPEIQPQVTQEQLPIPPNANAILNQTEITRYDNNATMGVGGQLRPSEHQEAPPKSKPNTGDVSEYNMMISGTQTSNLPTDINRGPPIAAKYNPRY